MAMPELTMADCSIQMRQLPGLRRAGHLMPGSQVQSCGGSDTPALLATTKSVLKHKASVGCEVEAGCGPDELRPGSSRILVDSPSKK